MKPATEAKEVQVVDPTETLPGKPNNLIEYAIYQNAPIETLKELMELQERDDANKARKAYHKAMAAFKRNPPDIYKDATVDFTSSKGRTLYNHATLGNVCKVINAALGEHGLTAAWKTSQDNNQITVTCHITHELGHGEFTGLSAASDSTGNKNPIQAIGSTVSYLQRYTLLALTGLATKEQDDDGVTTATGEPGPFEKWDIKLTESTANGNPEDVVKFWKTNGDQIKKDCGKVKAAKIHSRSLALKKELDGTNQ